MKKFILSFCILFFAFGTAFSQESSQLFFEYETQPSYSNIEVYINFKDGKINTDNPFTYYDKLRNRKEIPVKELNKDLRLKLKKNKKINEDSYFIILNGCKDVKIVANYSAHSNSMSIFFKPEKFWYNIEKITLFYKDDKGKKLDFVKLKCKHFVTRGLKFFELKK